MLKQAWSTYWKSFNPNNFKSDKSKGKPVDYFWLFWIFLVMQNPEGKFYILARLIPLFIMLSNNIVGKLYMPKAIYFTPMGVEGRKKYINALLLCKIGVPTIANVILYIIYSVKYEFDLFACLVSAFAQFSLGIGMYVCCEMRSKYDRYMRYAVPGKDGTGKDAWLNFFCMILGMVASIFFEHEPNRIGLLIFDIIVLAILLIMDIAILKSRYQITVNYICDYEESHNVLGKVK